MTHPLEQRIEKLEERIKELEKSREVGFNIYGPPYNPENTTYRVLDEFITAEQADKEVLEHLTEPPTPKEPREFWVARRKYCPYETYKNKPKGDFEECFLVREVTAQPEEKWEKLKEWLKLSIAEFRCRKEYALKHSSNPEITTLELNGRLLAYEDALHELESHE